VSRQRLGDLLVQANLLTQNKLEFALKEHLRTGVRLGQILVDHGLVEESKLFDVLAQLTGMERLSLQNIEVDRTAAAMVESEWALREGMIPVARDQRARLLTIAVTDPTAVGSLDDLAFRTGFRIRAILGSETEVIRLIRHHFFHEPLQRETGDLFFKPGHPTTGRIEIEDGMIVREMEAQWDHVQHSAHGIVRKPLPRIDSDAERRALSALKPVFDGQQLAARELKVIFDLCVARGIIRPEEYFERLSRLPD
jgi:hypothetical protein